MEEKETSENVTFNEKISQSKRYDVQIRHNRMEYARIVSKLLLYTFNN